MYAKSSLPWIILAGLTLLVAAGAAAQEAESAEPSEPDPPAEAVSHSSPRGFINNVFFTGQFGGGTMASLGGGVAFLDNIVRPEVLFGYTVSDGFSGFSVNARLNARVFALPINDWFGMYGALGTSFTFFSTNSQIASAAFIAEEFEFVDVMGVPSLSLYVEQDFFFVPTTEGNMLFQLGIGVRTSLF